MTIQEPTLLLTDLLLAAVAGWFAWSLRLALPTNGHAAHWWARALALAALSGLIGGLYHAFAQDFPPAVASSWWFATLLVVCAVNLAMDFGLVHAAVPVARRRHWSVAVFLKFVAFGIVAIIHPVFLVAIIDYGLSLMAWMVAALVLRRRWRGWMLVGIGLSVVAAVVQQMDWEIFTHSNYDNLYHVIQAVALYGFYRAARGLSP